MPSSSMAEILMRNGEYILIIAPKDYPGTLYRGRYCYEHLAVYWENYGVLPKKDEIIHHIDGNKHNNTPSNLKKMTVKEHNKLHGKGRKMCKFKCTGCGKIFSKPANKVTPNRKFTCCSRRCVGITTGLPKDVQEKRISENFIETFVE